MATRLTAHVCALLVAATPVVTAIEVLSHHQEHHAAVAHGTGHSHEHGHTHHYHHDPEGNPIPVDEPVAPVRVASGTVGIFRPYSPQLADFPPAVSIAHAPELTPLWVKVFREVQPVRVPSPGDTLPLLI